MKLKEFLNLSMTDLLISKDGKTLYSIESMSTDTQDDVYGTTLITLCVESTFDGPKTRKLVRRENYKEYQIYTNFEELDEAQ